MGDCPLGHDASTSHPTQEPRGLSPPGAPSIRTSVRSTTSEWEWVKIRRPAGPTRQPAEGGPSRARLARRLLRKPLPAVMKYRGGPECWVEITARGQVYRFPGHVALVDVILRINGLDARDL